MRSNCSLCCIFLSHPVNLSLSVSLLSESATQVSAEAPAPFLLILQSNGFIRHALSAAAKSSLLSGRVHGGPGPLRGQHPPAEEPAGRLPAAGTAGVQLALVGSGPPRRKPLPRTNEHQGRSERARLRTTLQVPYAQPERPERDGSVISVTHSSHIQTLSCPPCHFYMSC